MATSKNAHTLEQKQFIVRKLAAFEPHREVANAFAARFRDTACNEDDVRATDPRLTIVAPELFTLFTTERERVLLDETLAPFAKQHARLIVLSRQAERYENNNQPAEARAVFRQIAEELGVIGGKAGKGGKAADESGTRQITEIVETIIDPVPPGTIA